MALARYSSFANTTSPAAAKLHRSIVRAPQRAAEARAPAGTSRPSRTGAASCWSNTNRGVSPAAAEAPGGPGTGCRAGCRVQRRDRAWRRARRSAAAPVSSPRAARGSGRHAAAVPGCGRARWPRPARSQLADGLGRAVPPISVTQYPAAASVSASRRGRRSISSAHSGHDHDVRRAHRGSLPAWAVPSPCGGRRRRPPHPSSSDVAAGHRIDRESTLLAVAAGPPSARHGRDRGRARPAPGDLPRPVAADEDAGLAVGRPPRPPRPRRSRPPDARPTWPRARSSAAPRPRWSGTGRRPRRSRRGRPPGTQCAHRPIAAAAARSTASASGPAPTRPPRTAGSTGGRPRPAPRT